MFIRLKPRRSGTAPLRYAVQVCESRRINGRPRQRVLYHLGIYQPESGPAVEAFYFSIWQRLFRLPEAERVAISEKLRAVVPWEFNDEDPAPRCQRRGHSWYTPVGHPSTVRLCAWCGAFPEAGVGVGTTGTTPPSAVADHGVGTTRGRPR